MRRLRKTVLLCAAALIAGSAVAFAGQPMNVPLPAGVRFCPAPGADNTAFMESYFSVDARTGQMTRHDPGSPPIGVEPEVQGREEVLFVAPPISVENVYVPPPGGPALPPRTQATGVMRPPAPQRQYQQPQYQYQQYPYQAQAQQRQAPPQRRVLRQQPLAPYPQQQYRR